MCVQHHALEHGTRAWTKQVELFPGPAAELGSDNRVGYRSLEIVGFGLSDTQGSVVG